MQLKVYLNVQILGNALQQKFYGCCHKEPHESHLYVAVVHFFQLVNLNGNLIQFGPSEIYYLRDRTARNGSLDM